MNAETTQYSKLKYKVTTVNKLLHTDTNIWNHVCVLALIYSISTSQSLSCSQRVVLTYAVLTSRQLYSPWWFWGGCSGCFRMWRASTLHLLPAAGGGGNFLRRCTPAWGNTSCPGHTNRIQTWGWPSGTYRSCPATPCICTGGLKRQKEMERIKVFDMTGAVIKHYCQLSAVEDNIRLFEGVNNSHNNYCNLSW